jgi:hypothetical protein
MLAADRGCVLCRSRHGTHGGRAGQPSARAYPIPPDSGPSFSRVTPLTLLVTPVSLTL